MKKLVIVGAGLSGLAAAKELRHSDAEVFVVKRITTSFSICSIKWAFSGLKSGVRSVDF